MIARQYTVRELKKIISESVNEFKPKLGDSVQKDNLKNNEKAYKDAESNIKDTSKNIKNNAIYAPMNDNKGMQDIDYDNINDEFKDKVKSQMKGYVSVDAEKKHKKDDYGNADFNDIKGFDVKNKILRKGKKVGKEIGLTTRKLKRDELENLTHSVYEGKKNIRLKFKHTEFVNENHMLTKIPDEFKKDGTKIQMVDKNNNEYIVEWSETPKVVCTTKINEQKNRIHELFNYKQTDTKTNCNSRLQEETKITEVLDKVRQLF